MASESRGPTPPGGWVDEIHRMPSAHDCPECRQGKHTICVEWSLDDADNVVACPCAEREHRMVSELYPPVHVRVYAVEHREVDGMCVYVCPICGPLSGAVLKGHGPNHMVEDASR